MAMIAKKKKVDNKAGLIVLVRGIDRSKVEKVQDFGRFLVVLLKDSAVYHSYTGFEIRCNAWCRGMSSETKRASLYEWLVNLVGMKEACIKHGKENYPETGMSYNDLLDTMVIVTEANLTHPITAFTDVDEAAKFANEYIAWLGDKMKELGDTMDKEAKEESSEDLKKDFEHGLEAINKDGANEVLKDIQKANERLG